MLLVLMAGMNPTFRTSEILAVGWRMLSDVVSVLITVVYRRSSSMLVVLSHWFFPLDSGNLTKILCLLSFYLLKKVY